MLPVYIIFGRLNFINKYGIILMLFDDGEVSEWSKVIDSKSIVPQGTVGSNPTLSAIMKSRLCEFSQGLLFI